MRSQRGVTGASAAAKAAALIAVVAAASAIAVPVRAQTDYPVRSIRFIVPSAPGPFDTVARLLGERLQKALGQPLVMDNVAGAAGTLGMAAIARAAPDGYTIGMALMPTTMAEALYPGIAQRVNRDVAPIVQISWGYLVLAVHPSIPVKSVAELVSYLKANPARINFGSGGHGAPAHILGTMFAREAGVDIVHVPFKSVAFAIQDLLAGRVHMMFGFSAGMLPHIRAGKLTGLAVAGRERLQAIPELPSMAEAGYPAIALRDWIGLVAPARTPPAVIERLNHEMNAILKEPEVRDRLAAGNVIVAGGTPQELARLIAEDSERLVRVIREAGIRAD